MLLFVALISCLIVCAKSLDTDMDLTYTDVQSFNLFCDSPLKASNPSVKKIVCNFRNTVSLSQLLKVYAYIWATIIVLTGSEIGERKHFQRDSLPARWRSKHRDQQLFKTFDIFRVPCMAGRILFFAFDNRECQRCCTRRNVITS